MVKLVWSSYCLQSCDSWGKTADRTLAGIKADKVEDETRVQLTEIKNTQTHKDAKVLADLKKRKLVVMQKLISFKIDKGPKFALEIVKEETDLTAEMIAKYFTSLFPLS